MQAPEIRQKFLEFFEKHGHRIFPSSSLVPANDPTLLFTNAGMVQFKDVFTGKSKRDFRRAVTSQKCVRAGGKHNDLENVGFTARHHTFFEMLGNFSFGDYFKREAIGYAWDFLTKVMRLDPERLWITVFRDDDEAEEIWHEQMGVPMARIVRRGEKDNFWAMGDTGPCGPCSEILYDQGPQVGCKRPECNINCDQECDRYLEIWNLVFMQFNRHADGKMEKLPNPSIDTGMGLERVTAITEGVASNYEIGILKDIITHAAGLAGIKPGTSSQEDVSLRVIADHSRATAFLIADGVLPSNEGAGYVLRRIMRRAIRHGKKLGLNKPFLWSTALKVVEIMSPTYPELAERRDFIREVTEREESRFAETLDHGLALLDEAMAKKPGTLSGDVVFKLYDTFGFPVDLTEVIARERGFSIDLKGFEAEMDKQRGRSHQAGKSLGKAVASSGAQTDFEALLKLTGEVEFVGYKEKAAAAKLAKLIPVGDEMLLVAHKTPFYGESGGQVGDTGTITTEKGFRFEVRDTQKPLPGLFVHYGRVTGGTVQEGEPVTLSVDAARRQAIMINHSATHLIHAALRTVLGKHVHQKGSLVAPERLRFDFTHFEPAAPAALKEIEDLCNEQVRANHPVKTEVLPYAEAVATGAMALFGEKYGDRVRVVSMSPFSVELCGGTHVAATGEIGFIRLRFEAGVASGVRRLEAVTGQGALDFVRTLDEQMAALARKLKSGASFQEIEQRVEKLFAQQKKLEEDLQRWQSQAASGQNVMDQVRELGGVKVLAARIDDLEPKDLRAKADELRDRLKSGVVALGSKREGKASLVVVVTKDLTGKYQAGQLIKEMAKLVGGTGGGRPDMAQAGGDNPAGLDEALAKLTQLIT